jgi:hypothetical protein
MKTAEKWTWEEIENFFRTTCKFELTMNEKTWENVVIPMFERIKGLEDTLVDFDNELNQKTKWLKDAEDARDQLRQQANDFEQMANTYKQEYIKLQKKQNTSAPIPFIKHPLEQPPFKFPASPNPFPPKETWTGDFPPGMMKFPGVWVTTTTGSSDIIKDIMNSFNGKLTEEKADDEKSK